MTRLQSRKPRAVVVDQGDQDADALREFRYGWIEADAAVRHLGLASVSGLYHLIREHGLPKGRAGRRLRFRRADLDQWVKDGGRDAVALRKAM